MQIAHIFNAIEKENNNQKADISAQELKLGYWENDKDIEYNPPDLDTLDSDFAKKYYYSLYPSKDKKIISKYDDEKINSLVDKLGDELLIINGNFWGIQEFIFDGITTDKASKILRSRSAMIQLVTYSILDFVKNQFKESDSIIFGSGRFLILARDEKEYIGKIDDIQKKIDSYFLSNFFGQNGFILSAVKTDKENIINQKSKEMRDALNLLEKENSKKEFHKFDLLNVDDNDIRIDPFEKATINDNNSCKFCNKRIVDSSLQEDSCLICDNQINLGKKLATFDYINIIQFGKLSSTKKIQHNMIEIIKLENKSYYASFNNNKTHFKCGKTFDIRDKPYDDKTDKWSLASYISQNEDETIKTFSDYVKNGDKVVSSGLMAVKADIDKLGDTFKEFYYQDFKKFNRLSREIDLFFSDYITSLISKKKNVYIVYSGGDDLLFIGEYRDVILLIKEIREKFYNFSLQKRTLSMGVVMFKPTTPMNYISRLLNEAEARAKNVLKEEDIDKSEDEKRLLRRDGIDIFGISMKFDEFYEIEEDFKCVADFLEKEEDDKTAFYYRIIELCDMQENINKDIRNAMWKSKLNYLFRRNIKREDNDSEIFTKLSNLIERGEKFKPSIFLKIYYNKDNKKEKRDERF